MAGGRAKQIVHQYYFDGSYVKSWPSIDSVRQQYFPNNAGKTPIFNQLAGRNYERRTYQILHDDTIIMLDRPGREKIKEIIKFEKSNFRKVNAGKTPRIEVLNMAGEFIAEFASVYAMSQLTNLPETTIWSRVNKADRNYKCKRGLIIRFKEDGD